jgi:hypothetical protein
MCAKLFVELGVEVGSRLAFISIQLNSSLAATVVHFAASAKTSQSLASHGRRPWLAVLFDAHAAIEPWLAFIANGASRLMLEFILHHLGNAAAHIPERVQYLSTVYREAQRG